MFVDMAKIYVKGGAGGDGCCSFRREKFVPKGGPDGGDGGAGGDIIIKTDLGEQSLVAFRYNQHYAAKHGGHGKGKNLHGRKSDDVVLRVPLGTVVKDEDGNVLADMDYPDMEFVVAKGGRGGKGNPRFATSANRVPMESEPGAPGEERRVVLELKTIADVGLVGYPNAGKSTLLGAISDAHPKVAPYPFTTLHPVVGVVKFGDFERLTVADIPGLIDGAHDDVGLGHSFLRHIERTKLLVYVLDMAGTDGRTPWDDFHSLEKELELYMKGLSGRNRVIAANKMDVPEAGENLELLKSDIDPNIPIVSISAKEGDSLDELISVMKTKLADASCSA
jgi:GTP-binding protein